MILIKTTSELLRLTIYLEKLFSNHEEEDCLHFTTNIQKYGAFLLKVLIMQTNITYFTQKQKNER